jgi:selenocysteine lyase/cysteine desulfurase
MEHMKRGQKTNTLDYKRIRNEFPGTGDKTFLDAACLSIAPKSSIDAVTEFAQRALLCPADSATLQHLEMDALRRAAIPVVAELISSEPEDVALVESTTHGLNIAAKGIEFPPDTEILVSEMEFLQSPIPWIMQGYHVVPVSAPGGRVLPEMFEKHVTSKTGVVVLSSTQWNNGFRADLEAFSSFCHERNLLFVVDAVQQLGAISIDVDATKIDILTAGGHKWLNSPFGCGLLYVSPETRERMSPMSWGYLNLEDPEGGWGTYFSTPEIRAVRSMDEYQFVSSAKQLEMGGTSNYPGAVGLAQSLQLVNQLGKRLIEEHVLNLTDVLIEGLHEIGVQVVTVPERKYRSGIVSFRFYEDLDAERDLLLRLHKQRIYISLRFTGNVGGLRVSCHYFNTTDHIKTLLDSLREESKRGSTNKRAAA